MKIIRFILLLLTVSCIYSCITDHPSPQVLKVSENNLRFSGRGGVWKLYITSNSGWEISGETDWCRPEKATGYNTEEIIITVDSNTTHAKRNAQLLFQSEKQEAAINIQQDTATGQYHYELPVIFHIFYTEDQDTSKPQVNSGLVMKLLDGCNSLYSNSTNSIDMNLQFVPASEDIEGNPLQEAGINRIRVSNNHLSCENFMAQTTKNYTKYLWNLNQYINVFVYYFTESNVLGIAHLPYTPRENSLPGLTANNRYFYDKPDYAHCVSLNRTNLLDDDAPNNLAHELGHYLGLFHVFSEKECTETDYCDDTPNYDRKKYEESIAGMEDRATNPEAKNRTSCEGVLFTSYNIMDYFYTWQNQFTLDQYSRVRHVLENSPLIPGPKNVLPTKTILTDIIPEARAIK